MKVYVITKGDYSCYHICAVTLDEKHAEKLAKLYTDSMDTAEIEEYDTEEYLNELAAFDDTRLPYRVKFNNAGEVITVWRCGFANFKPGIYRYKPILDRPNVVTLAICLYAPDEQAAVKIAAEKRAEFLARELGI